jgi:hypothetical protein
MHLENIHRPTPLEYIFSLSLYGSTVLYGPGPPRFVEVSWSHTFETHQSVGLLWTRDQLVADLYLTTHNTHKRQTSMP